MQHKPLCDDLQMIEFDTDDKCVAAALCALAFHATTAVPCHCIGGEDVHKSAEIIDSEEWQCTGGKQK